MLSEVNKHLSIEYNEIRPNISVLEEMLAFYDANYWGV